MKTNNSELILDTVPNTGSFFTRFFKKTWKDILNSKYMLLAFFLPVVILAITYAIVGMIPRDGTSILILDANAQYVRFHEQLRSVLLGEESFFYTFQRALGGEFLGFYTYYLASPFSLIVALFPRNKIVEALTLIAILKAGFSGLTFSYYLRKTRPVNQLGFTMFSVMYALCAYATSYQSNYMWMDALIWLPLITLGIELLIKEKKLKLFIISLAIAIWSNYYIGYMLCIFTLVYFVFFLSTHSKEIRNPSGEKLHILKSFLRYALCVIIALLICAAVLFSAVYSLRFGKADKMDMELLEPATRANFLEILTKLFIGTFGTFRPVELGGLPHIYAGTLLVILLPVFFISKQVKLREKIGYGILATFFLASLTISTLDFTWHGFSMPVWLPYRYSFIFSFVLLIIAYRGFEKIDEVRFKYFAIAIPSIVGILFVLQMTVKPIQYVNGKSTPTNLGVETIWITILLLIGYFLIFYFLKFKPNKKRLLSILLCALVCGEALVSAVLCFDDQFTDAGYTSRKTYSQVQRDGSAIDEYFEKKDEGFYRVEAFETHYETNDALIYNLNGVSEFVSTYNIAAKDFIYALGYNAGDQSSLYFTRSALADSLLGIKYLYLKKDINSFTKKELDDLPSNTKNAYTIINNNYKKIDTVTTGYLFDGNSYLIYENPYALSIAYAVSDKLKDVTFEKALEDTGANHLSTLHNRTSTVVNGKYCEPYFDEYLVKNMLMDGSTARFDDIDAVISALRKGELNVTNHSDTRIEGNITVLEEQFVFTTIPYDACWQVYVDGEKVDTFKCVDSMLAFDVSAGEHNIEIKYVPMQWYIGLGVSLVGISAFLMLWFIEIFIKVKKSKKNDDLIEKEII